MSHDIILYDVELTTPNEIWSPNTCKTRFALNYKVGKLELFHTSQKF